MCRGSLNCGSGMSADRSGAAAETAAENRIPATSIIRSLMHSVHPDCCDMCLVRNRINTTHICLSASITSIQCSCIDIHQTGRCASTGFRADTEYCRQSPRHGSGRVMDTGFVHVTCDKLSSAYVDAQRHDYRRPADHRFESHRRYYATFIITRCMRGVSRVRVLG